MNGEVERIGREHGLTVVELLVVVAIVAIAASVATMILLTATRASGMQESRAVVASTIRRATSEAAKSGVTQGLDLWTIPVSKTVRLRTDAPAPLPESALLQGSVDLQGGTGYPFTNGTNRAVAVVISDDADPQTSFAVVLGQSATVTEYRLVEGSGEVAK